MTTSRQRYLKQTTARYNKEKWHHKPSSNNTQKQSIKQAAAAAATTTSPATATALIVAKARNLKDNQLTAAETAGANPLGEWTKTLEPKQTELGLL